MNKKEKNYWDICELLIILEYYNWEEFLVVIDDKFLSITNNLVFKINEQLLNDNGKLKKFEEQINDKTINGVPYIITIDDSIVTNQKRPLTINKSTVNKILEKHGYKKDQLYDLLDRINNYTLVTKSQNREDSIIIFTDFTDNEGRPEMISIVRGKNMGIYKVDNITSIYGRNNAKCFVEKLYYNNKFLKEGQKIKQWLESIGVQFSKDKSIVSPENNISQIDIKVNDIKGINTR